MFLRNVGGFLPHYTAIHPTRLYSTFVALLQKIELLNNVTGELNTRFDFTHKTRMKASKSSVNI
jgi:hypothetical protein